MHETWLRKINRLFWLVFFGIIMFLPFYWSLLTAIRPNQEIFALPPAWLPKNFTLAHFKSAFTTIPLGRYIINSGYLAIMGVLTNLFFGSLAGYAFAKLKFRGRQLIFRVLLSSLMIPMVVTMIPQFVLLKFFPLVGGNNLIGQGGNGLLNSYWGIILPGAAGAFSVFFMRQFFLTLPNDLAESARLEGAGEFRIFWQIYIPLTKPALATLAIFTFQAGWNNFFWPMIILNDPTKATVQMGLQAFSYNHATEYGPMMAASIVTTLPILILFIFTQKYFIQGIAFTGIKE